MRQPFFKILIINDVNNPLVYVNGNWESDINKIISSATHYLLRENILPTSISQVVWECDDIICNKFGYDYLIHISTYKTWEDSLWIALNRESIVLECNKRISWFIQNHNDELEKENRLIYGEQFDIFLKNYKLQALRGENGEFYIENSLCNGLGIEGLASVLVVIKPKNYKTEAIPINHYLKIIEEMFKNGSVAFKEIYYDLISQRTNIYDLAASAWEQHRQTTQVEWYKTRAESKQIRKEFVNAIDRYIHRHPELSIDYCEWVYVNVSERINRIVLGDAAKNIREQRQIRGYSIRANLSEKELRQIQQLEEKAANLITEQDMEPLLAIVYASDHIYNPDPLC